MNKDRLPAGLLLIFVAVAAQAFGQDRGDAPRRDPSSQAPTAGPTAPPGQRPAGSANPQGSPGQAAGPHGPQKPGAGLDSGIATLPAASNHQNAMKAGPEVDVLFNLVIGRIVETQPIKNGMASQLVWLQRILSPALGFDGRYIRPLGAGFRAAAGAKAELYFKSSGNQSASVGFTSTNSDKSSDKKFEVAWDAYAVSTWQKGRLRLHGGSQFGNSAKWVGVLSGDLGPMKGSMGAAPFFGADLRVGGHGRRIRLEIMAPLAYQKPPLVLFTKLDKLFQFNVGYVKTESGYAVIGYFDQRFGIIPAQPKVKPEEAAPTPTPQPNAPAATAPVSAEKTAAQPVAEPAKEFQRDSTVPSQAETKSGVPVVSPQETPVPMGQETPVQSGPVSTQSR